MATIKYVRNRSLSAACAGLVLLLAGCTSADDTTGAVGASTPGQAGSGFGASLDENHAVRITADSSSTEQVLWAYIYRDTLREVGRKAQVIAAEGATTAERWELLRTGEADLMITCTGTFVEELHPALAKQLVDDVDGQEPNTADIHEQMHREVMGLLPPDIVTTAPSSAEGCAHAGDALPQDFTPLFSSRLFDRDTTGEIQKVTRLVDDRALEELEEKLADGLSIEDAVGQWASVNGTGESPDSVSDDA